MKLKIKLLLVALTFGIGIFFNSCSNEDKNSNSNFKDFSEVNKFASIHSKGLSHNLKSFEKKLKTNRSMFMRAGQIDTLAIVNFYIDETQEFLENEPLTFNNTILGINYLMPVDDLSKIKIAENLETPEEVLTPSLKINYYYSRISQLIENNDSNINQFNYSLNALYNESLNDNISNEDRLTIDLMFGVANDSYTYWNNNQFLFETGKATGKVKGTTILADIKGAVDGALWGSVGGPFCSALMAINFGIIGSSVAHTLSTALNP